MEIDSLKTEIESNLLGFLSHTKTWFHPRDVWNEYNLKSEEAKRYLREALEDRVQASELQHEGQKYRLINRELREVDWFAASQEDYIKLNLPFELDKYIKLFPGIVVVAGEKGKGKSAWLFDCIFRNLGNRPQYLFCNDAQEVELKERFLGLAEKYDTELPVPPMLTCYERFDKFGDVVVKGGINYVDYLDVNTEFYSIGQEIDDIYRATGDGITFVALQKNPKEAIGVGGIYSWKRAQLYVTLADPKPPMCDTWQGEMKLVKTRGRTMKGVDPTGKTWHYDIHEGYRFLIEGTV